MSFGQEQWPDLTASQLKQFMRARRTIPVRVMEYMYGRLHRCMRVIPAAPPQPRYCAVLRGTSVERLEFHDLVHVVHHWTNAFLRQVCAKVEPEYLTHLDFRWVPFAQLCEPITDEEARLYWEEKTEQWLDLLTHYDAVIAQAWGMPPLPSTSHSWLDPWFL
jgi:hypothetical protein